MPSSEKEQIYQVPETDKNDSKKIQNYRNHWKTATTATTSVIGGTLFSATEETVFRAGINMVDVMCGRAS